MKTESIENAGGASVGGWGRRLLAGAGVAGLLAGATTARAQVPVLVDPAQAWQGYMNVFALPANGNGYQFGGPWGAADLRAGFANDLLKLQACTNVSNPTDSYWTNPDGSGAKQMQANWYVDTAALVGSNVVFSGNVVDYSLTADQNCQAFIKVFNSGYGLLQQAYANLTNGNQFFSVNLTANSAGAAHVQYGFLTTAPNAPITPNAESTAAVTIRTNAVDPKNVLVNPGFEQGLTGWTAYGAGGNLESQSYFYFNGGNPAGASNVLVYQGTQVQKVFGQFTGGQNYSGVYQDVPTGAGSVWAATAKFLTHQQDQIGVWSGTGTNQCWLEVTFRDAGANVLAGYQSPIVDNSSPTNAWLSMTVTDGSGGTQLTAPAGTAFVRLQEVYYQPYGYAGGSVYADAMVLDLLSASDPNLVTPPANTTVVVGQTATLTVAAAGQSTLQYQWQRGGTNLVDGGNIAGSSTATLKLTNAQVTDSGTYTVTVTDLNGTLSSSAFLTVETAADAANLLQNPGFDTGVASPWATFNGAALVSDTTINNRTGDDSYDGGFAMSVYNGGQYDGGYQDVAVTPGTVVTADGRFMMPGNNPLGGGDISCWLEVQFLNGSTPLALYKSATITAVDAANPFPDAALLDTWFPLQATNGFAGDFTTPTVNGQYLTAPAGTTKARFQVTVLANSGGGVVYFDAMRLLVKKPVTLSAVSVPGGLKLSWPTQGAATYQVVYKTNLTDANWTANGAPVTGDGTVQSVTLPATGAHRFYKVLTQ